MTERISHEDMGFGDIQVEEKPKSNAPATEAVAPPASQPVMPSVSQPLPTKAVAAPAVAPPLPPMPAAKSKVTAKDILPPLPNMPDVTKDPAFIKNAETAGAIGAGTVGLMTLLGIGGAALTAHLAKKYGAKPETPSGPELTYTPPQAPVAETPVAETPVTETPKQTIQNRTFSPKEAAVASNITDNYPFSLQEAKNGLGIGDVKITDSTQAKLVADQYAKQLQAQAAANAPATPSTSVTPETSPASATTATSEKLPAVNKSVTPPGMREQYAKGKKNPIGPGGYNWVAGQEGPERAPATWKDLFGEKNVPYAEAMQKFREFELTGQEPGRGLNEIPRSAMGGSHKTPKYIPEYIKGNANIGGMLGAGGAALGALGAYEAYKHGKETGDWTPAGELALNTIVSAVNPALMFGTHMTGLNADEDKKLAQKKYEAMVGGGRGIAPPSPRTQVGRR